MAEQLAKNGVDASVLKNLGPDAEIQYLRTRAKQLEEIINQQNLEYQTAVSSQSDFKSQIQVLTQQRDRLQKQATQANAKQTQLNQQNEAQKNQIQALQMQLDEIQSKTEQAQRVAQNGISATSVKEKQISRLVDNIEMYKKQLNESNERETLLKQKIEEGGAGFQNQLKKKEKEKEELLNIVKKQQ